MSDHELSAMLDATIAERSATQLLRRGTCFLAALRAANAGVLFGPTLDDRFAMLDRAREELLQLELVDELYAELTGQSLLEAAQSMLDALPAPTSWLDATLARLLVCLSSRIELEQSHEPGRFEVRMLAREMEHVNAAYAALLELGADLHEHVDLRRPFASKWLEVALQALADEAARTAYLCALEREFGLGLPN